LTFGTRPTSDLRLPSLAASPPAGNLSLIVLALRPDPPTAHSMSLARFPGHLQQLRAIWDLYESCSSPKRLGKQKKKKRRTWRAIKNSFTWCFGLCKDGGTRIAQASQGQPVGIDGLFQQFGQICPVKQNRK